MQPPEPEIKEELARVTAEYQRRGASKVAGGRYSLFDEAALLHAQSLERGLLTLLKRFDFTQLADKKILDVGCGSGSHLRRFLEYGAQPANLAGIDLLESRIERASALNPAIDWRVGSAHQLPYPDASFDLVTSFVVFSSVLSATMRRMIANEMWRVRKPGGLIVCYDFVYSKSAQPSRARCLPAAHPGAVWSAWGHVCVSYDDPRSSTLTADSAARPLARRHARASAGVQHPCHRSHSPGRGDRTRDRMSRCVCDSVAVQWRRVTNQSNR